MLFNPSVNVVHVYSRIGPTVSQNTYDSAIPIPYNIVIGRNITAKMKVIPYN